MLMPFKQMDTNQVTVYEMLLFHLFLKNPKCICWETDVSVLEREMHQVI